jgi:hypothetical protein
MRMGILTIMILGSLIFNIIIYSSNVFGKTLLLCRWKFTWMENLNPVFEILKRLNGLYILIFIFTGKEYLRVIRNRAKKVKRTLSERTTYSMK